MPSPQMNDPSSTPHGESTFEHFVRRLHLSPEEYSTSAELKEWVRKNKDSKYVPPYLLELWGFEVDVKLFDHEKKPPKRAA